MICSMHGLDRDWAVKRFIEFLSVAETVTHWVITKSDIDVLKDKSYNYTDWGIIMWEWELLYVIY